MDEGVAGNVSVEREVLTDSGNRIDILIESDTHTVLIENKIFASVTNPFADYADYLDRRTPESHSKHKLLLTIFPTDEGSDWAFRNLTYAELVDRIQSMLGRYVSGADTRYLTLLLDFLNTLENLQEGTRMNQEFLKLLSERQDDVENLLSELTTFTNELRDKLWDLRNLIEVGKHQHVSHTFVRERMSVFDNLRYFIVFEDLRVFIDTSIGPGGWVTDICAYRGDRSKLIDILESSGISYEEKQGSKDCVSIPHARFDYGENLDNIRSELQELIDKIATGRAAGAADPQAESATSDPGPS